MRRVNRLLIPTALTATVLIGLAGCSAASPSASPSSGGKLQVVASTDVWGSVATLIGGDQVSVTSIIDDPDKDPHEYEADARTQLTLSKAAVVIENGGGYDDFVDTMLKSAKNTSAVKINAVDISGKAATAGDDLNEHVWYDFPTVEKVADKILAAYTKADPDDAATFTSNAADLKTKIDALEQREADLKTKYQGEGASITEPVPLYMLDAIGLVDKTPEKFSEAIENDTDVAPAILQQTLALYSDHAVVLLAYNEQTTGAQTEAVLNAAKANDIPVVPVTETLPKGTDYLSWMSDNLDAISAALAG